MILSLLGAAVISISLLGNSSSDPGVAGLPTVHPAETDDGVLVAAQPSIAPTVEADPTATEEPLNRANCADIVETPYRSPTERAWFIQNCQATPESGAGEIATPAALPVSPTEVEVPTAPGESEQETVVVFSSADAVIWVAGWLAEQAPLGLVVRAEACAASRSASNQWLVSCLAQAPGCVSAECEALLSACLIEVPLTIWRC